MPYFTPDDIDIEVGDFLSSCRENEIKELIEYLIEDGYIDAKQVPNTEKHSLIEWEFDEVISKIAENRLRLTSEEDALLKKISDRF